MHVDYDAVAPHYDRRYDREDHSGVEQTLTAFVGDATPSTSILEVGCGTGHWLRWLTERGSTTVAGLEPSTDMLAIATAKVGSADLRQGYAEDVPWSDDTFDRMLCVNALHHFTDKPGAIVEAARVLRSRGALLTLGLDPHVGSDRWVVYDFFDGTLDADLERYPPTAAVRRWMADAGFVDVHTFVAMHRPTTVSARAALADGYLDRHATSQLTLLSDDAYARGISRIIERSETAEQRGETFEIRSDLRLYATVGRLP